VRRKYTMYTRVARAFIVSMFVVPCLASCAGDDDVTSVDQEVPCTPNMMSTALVGMDGMDPCPQGAMGCPESCTAGTMIPSSTPNVMVPCPTTGGFVAVAQCGMDMKWSKSCQCMPKGGAGTSMPVCGNSTKEGNEQCDGPVPADVNCMKMMGAGAMGTITCSATCQLQITCTKPAMMTGGTGDDTTGGGTGG